MLRVCALRAACCEFACASGGAAHQTELGLVPSSHSSTLSRMGCNWNRVVLGRSAVPSSALGIGSSFGIQSPDLEYAFERGINYFYWGSVRRPGFGRAVRGLARHHRDRMVIVVQSYTRVGSLMRCSLLSGLRKLGADYADFLLLGWWNELPPDRILDAARALQEQGLARHLMISCHHRPSFQVYAELPDIDAVMVRYNAAHPGAEEEVFPHLGEDPPGVVAYTATRWSDLVNPSLTPEGLATPRASDCYRFVLSNSSVNCCITGPKNRAELDEAMCALDRGPMDPDELSWMRLVGAGVKKHARPHSGSMSLVDRLTGIHSP